MTDKRGKALNGFIERAYEPGKEFTERWAQRLYRRLLRRYLRNEKFIESCRLNGVSADEVARHAVKTEIERRQAERLRRQEEERRPIIIRLTKKAIAEFRELWSGDPRLPYQGWFGKLAKDHVIVAETLVASLFGNAAWLVFSIRNKWFRASVQQILDEVKRGLPHANSEGYEMLTFLGWGFGVMAICFAALLVIGIVYASVMWFIVNLRSEAAHESSKDKRG
jgi:hypothetical protein